MFKFKIKRHVREYIRIIKVSRKPSMKEFKEVVKVTGFGMLLFGFIGFAVQFIFNILPI